MIFNHLRQTPRDWDDSNASLCPECGADLVAKRGELVRWHWAHKAGGHAAGCSMATSPETEWHLRWKYAYASCPGWRSEHSVSNGLLSFRLDAGKEHGKLAREFVHTIPSDRYVNKWLNLQFWGWHVLWIFDGELFAAARCKPVANGGLKHLLKPCARRCFGEISFTPELDGKRPAGSSAALVHFDGRLWHEWKDDVWFPSTGDAALSMLRKYAEVDL